MLYAITINQGHSMYADTCDNVIILLINELRITYADIVNHANDHYHALISTEVELVNNSIYGKMFHFEKVRNIPAYIKYMHSHDVTSKALMGELPYFETDSMIDYLQMYGPVKTVQKYGFQALKYYKNIKEFYYDMSDSHKGD